MTDQIIEQTGEVVANVAEEVVPAMTKLKSKPALVIGGIVLGAVAIGALCWGYNEFVKKPKTVQIGSKEDDGIIDAEIENESEDED